MYIMRGSFSAPPTRVFLVFTRRIFSCFLSVLPLQTFIIEYYLLKVGFFFLQIFTFSSQCIIAQHFHPPSHGCDDQSEGNRTLSLGFPLEALKICYDGNCFIIYLSCQHNFSWWILFWNVAVSTYKSGYDCEFLQEVSEQSVLSWRSLCSEMVSP